MSDTHDFCRQTLRDVRGEAKLTGVKLPKHVTALVTDRVGRSQYFIESEGFKGEYFNGDCAFDAKTKFFRAVIDGLEGATSFKLEPTNQ